MTEKVCQLYEEEQVGKIRNGKKAIPDSKMPDLGWDATEELEIQGNTEKQHRKQSEIKETWYTYSEKTIITIAILILTFIETIKSHIQKFQETYRKAVQAVTKTTKNNQSQWCHSKRSEKSTEKQHTVITEVTENNQS